MKKFILGLIIGLSFVGATTYAAYTFQSFQVGSSPSNGEVLQTDGTNSTWIATSSLFGFTPLSSYDAWTHGAAGKSATTSAIGIGSSTPWGMLSITQTGTDPAFIVEDSASPDTSPFIINASGNVGIGTTGPLAKLDVKGQSPLILSNTDYVVGSAGTALYTTFGAASGDTYAQMQVFDAGANSANNLVINSQGGNVGIGTTGPGVILDVVGTTGRISAVNANWRAVDGTIVTKVQSLTTGYTGGWVGTESANDLQIVTGNSPKITVLNTSGNVGIGTTTPFSKFHVTSGASATTTVNFGSVGNLTSTSCFNTKNIAGGDISFYFVGTTMMVENNMCR